ncbi:prepilin-type N-terminal cleavage/methylation domain-containing protein [Eubacterium maltosivorans]|uniref:type II secretion system protein n=1 Tax=Eubacterium maltosivorans TaxID=2041044 RepID=UPI0008895184|nr:type II secretion system protein [Eubacterium maltosivorans]WPK82094.1 hypothetical protein EUMA32_35550 [Eubacterium maltosivorans]SDP64858.1 prepilin-type N-terminal cleavage/methylation domain-containing protein [Eubacterium maltosivorans]
MIQMINKLKKNQKGFTLVELIVVLVILAILAAFTIPAMLGFVNDAKGKAYVAEAREVYMAYQGAISEQASSSVKTTISASYTQPGTGDITDLVQKSALNKLDGDIVTVTMGTDNKMTAKVNNSEIWAVTVDIASNKVTKVQYLKGGYQVDVDYDQASGTGTTIIKNDTNTIK